MAIEDVAVIGVAVETSGIEKGKKSLDDLARSGKQTEQSISGLEKQAGQTTNALRSLGAAATAALAGLGAGELIRLTDQYTKYTAQRKLATDSTTAYTNSLAQVQHHRIQKLAQPSAIYRCGRTARVVQRRHAFCPHSNWHKRAWHIATARCSDHGNGSTVA